jgi:hypothetical protein
MLLGHFKGAYSDLFLILASTNPAVGIRAGCIKE